MEVPAVISVFHGSRAPGSRRPEFRSDSRFRHTSCPAHFLPG